MRFVRKTDSFGRYYVHLELDGMSVPDSIANVPDLLDFRYETYKALKNSDEESWAKVFGPVDTFVNTVLNDDERMKFVVVITFMHYQILDVMEKIVQRKQLTKDAVKASPYYQYTAPIAQQNKTDGVIICDLENNLSAMLNEFDKEIDLYPKLVDYVERGNVPIQSFKGVGTRAQDTPEMSWYRPDIVKLTALVLLCKMFNPIFGVFMSFFKAKTGDLDGSYKEVHSVAILKDIIDDRCRDIIDKLEYYLNNTIDKMINSSNQENLTRTYNGCTDNAIHHFVYAQILTRRFVSVDLFHPSSNLMTFIVACAKSSTNTQFSDNNFRTAARTFTYPNDSDKEDDGNLSNLEVESRFSNKTADYELLVRVAAQQTVDIFINEYEMDREIVDSAYSYYTTSAHIDLTDYCMYMLGIAFGKNLCGARSVEMLNAVDAAKLVVVLQYYLIVQGYNDLAVAITAHPTGAHQDHISGQDVVLRNSWKSSFEYKNCAGRFQIELPNFKWSTGLENAINTFINEEHIINVAPALWLLMDSEPCNGEQYNPSTNFAKDTCSFIQQHYLQDDVV